MATNDEREQTLNQILTEMDGFSGNSGVIVIAATNRGDVLDSALLRPGRFDRRVPVDNPDKAGRAEILKVHIRGKPLAPDVDVDTIAGRTVGFSGAQLQNLMNEAAIVAARRDKDVITFDEIDFALDRLTVGMQKTTGTSSKDRQQVLRIARAMVTQFGYSKRTLAPTAWETGNENGMSGKSSSSATSNSIDEEG